MFEKVGLPEEYVKLALPAMDVHSQNDMLFDRKKARNLTSQELDESDAIFAFMGLPFQLSTSVEDFVNLVKIE